MNHNKNICEERTLSRTYIELGTSKADKPNTNIKVGESTGVASSMALEGSASAMSDDQLQETSGDKNKNPANLTPRVISYGLQPDTLEYTQKPADITLNQSVIHSSDITLNQSVINSSDITLNQSVINSSDAGDEEDSNITRSPWQPVSKNSAPLREKCPDHDEIIKMFCQQHDHVCCSSCIALHHRSCADVFYIPKLNKSVLEEEREVRIETSLENVLTDLKGLEQQRTEELGENEKDWSGDLEEIKALKKNLTSKIEDLESKSEKVVRERRSEVERALKDDILMVQDMIKSAEVKMEQLNQNKEYVSQSEFVTRKLSKKFLIETETVLKDMASVKPDIMKFYLDKGLQISLDDCKSFGEMKLVESGCATMLLGKYNLKTWRDSSLPRMFDLCITCAGDILVTDINNNSLKRLDKSFKVREQLAIAGGPFGICETSFNRFAVTILHDMNVQFVDLTSSMKRGTSFKVGVRCRGICYSREELFISCGGCVFLDDNEGPGHIRVYNMTGTLVRNIQLDEFDQRIFDIPRHLAASPDGESLYVADNRKGLLVITREGRVKEILNKPTIRQPYGVCLGMTDGSKLFVCSIDTSTVYHLEKNGTLVSEPLGRADGLYRPMAIQYCPQSRELLVTSEKFNEQLIVFRLITETEI